MHPEATIEVLVLPDHSLIELFNKLKVVIPVAWEHHILNYFMYFEDIFTRYRKQIAMRVVSATFARTESFMLLGLNHNGDV